MDYGICGRGEGGVMADITMCSGELGYGEMCPMRGNCYRHTATANEWQSYFVLVPYNPAGFPKCEYYWDDKEGGE